MGLFDAVTISVQWTLYLSACAVISCFEDSFAYFNPFGCPIECFDPTNLISQSAICHHQCFELCDCCAAFTNLICPVKPVCFLRHV